MFRCLKKTKQNTFLFSIFSWKWSEPRLTVVSPRSEAGLPLVAPPIPDWPRWELGMGAGGGRPHKTAHYVVVYSRRTDCHFMPRLALGTGGSEMGRIWPPPVSRNLRTDARENTLSNTISHVKSYNKIYTTKGCGFAQRAMTNSAGSVKVIGSGKVVGASFKSFDLNAKECVTRINLDPSFLPWCSLILVL